MVNRGQVRSTGLLWAVVRVVLGAVASAALLWILLTRLLRHRWPWQPGLNDSVNAADTTRIVLTVVGGVGAAVALVVAYRRQRDLELSRFDERFAAAAGQLGAPTAAERLAGVYAMAALADQWSAHRQQCIDVLCAYLRLPYDPSSGLLKTVTVEHTQPPSLYGPTHKEIRTYERLPNDREVRLTIIRTITAHLQEYALLSWKKANLDFTGATFDGGSFNRSIFSGGNVSFDRAVFFGGEVSFSDAKFSGGRVSFSDAKFSAGKVDFDRAKFSAGKVDFDRATFAGSQVSFDRATFAGSQVSFDRATFAGSQVSFDRATFAGSQVSFDRAVFNRSVFSGGKVDFSGVFSGGKINFSGVFPGGEMSFSDAKFSGAEVSFSESEFSAGKVTFDRAKFSAGKVDFDRAMFFGGQVSSNGVDFRGWPSPV